MKILQSGSVLNVYGNDLVVLDKIPVGTYAVRFGTYSGFFLEQIPDISVAERMFGNREEKIDKILRSYDVFANELGRNLGVMLSGSKGIGKTMFAKKLAERAIQEGYPVLVVNSNITGLVDFISSIDQNVVVMFDEFDKVFKEDKDQEGLLGLFDGLCGGTKLFVITANRFNSISTFLVNRPGRCHYHIRFTFLCRDEVTEYMLANLDRSRFFDNDQLNKVGLEEVANVVKFSQLVRLNYDCLRSIVYELNLGIKFADCIDDLNIINSDSTQYIFEVEFDTGATLVSGKNSIDFFTDSDINVMPMYGPNDDRYGHLKFRPMFARVASSYSSDRISLDVSKVEMDLDEPDEDDSDEYRKTYAEMSAAKIVSVTAKLCMPPTGVYNLHRLSI